MLQGKWWMWTYPLLGLLLVCCNPCLRYHCFLPKLFEYPCLPDCGYLCDEPNPHDYCDDYYGVDHPPLLIAQTTSVYAATQLPLRNVGGCGPRKGKSSFGVGTLKSLSYMVGYLLVQKRKLIKMQAHQDNYRWWIWRGKSRAMMDVGVNNSVLISTR